MFQDLHPGDHEGGAGAGAEVAPVPALPLPLAVPRPPALLVPAIPAHPDFFSRTVRASVSTKHEFDDKRVKIGVLCVGEQVRALV